MIREKTRIADECDIIPSSDKVLQTIDAEMTRENTREHGYIVWLKRLHVNNPNYLSETRPDVLPNPRMRDTILGATEAPVPSDGLLAVAANDESEADAIESSRISPNSQIRIAAQSEPMLQRKLTTEQNEAKDKRYFVKSAVAQMEKFANYMLTNSGALFDTVNSNNIVYTTICFKQKVLTSSEVQFFEDHKTGNNILRSIRVRAAQAEQEPWQLLRLSDNAKQLRGVRERMLSERAEREAFTTQLLRLPDNAKQLKGRREWMLREWAEREAFTTQLAMRIAVKRGHLSCNPEVELVTREGMSMRERRQEI